MFSLPRSVLCVLAVSTFFVLIPVQATTLASEYHIIPESGDDANPGTPAEPFRTLRHAIRIMQPGDTFILHEGRYPVRPSKPAPAIDAPADAPADLAAKVANLAARVEQLEAYAFLDMTSFEITTSGRPDAWITFKANPGDRVVISTEGNGFSLHPEHNLSHFIFDGLEIADCDMFSLFAAASKLPSSAIQYNASICLNVIIGHLP